ncbi:unnamed protein product [Penicillium pancosmium]
MALTQAAIIVIVLCACLAVTALGAALFKHYNPNEEEARYNTSYEQGQYMRNVRMRNYGHLRAESISAVKDLESSSTHRLNEPDSDRMYVNQSTANTIHRPVWTSLPIYHTPTIFQLRPRQTPTDISPRCQLCQVIPVSSTIDYGRRYSWYQSTLSSCSMMTVHAPGKPSEFIHEMVVVMQVLQGVLQV